MEIQVQKQGLSLRQIAAEVGCAVNTVRAYLARGEAPKYERMARRQTKLGPHEEYLRERQAAASPERIRPPCCCARLPHAATWAA